MLKRKEAHYLFPLDRWFYDNRIIIRIPAYICLSFLDYVTMPQSIRSLLYDQIGRRRESIHFEMFYKRLLEGILWRATSTSILAPV